MRYDGVMATPVATLAPTPAPDDPRLGAWRSFIHAHARLLRRLDEELQDAHGLSLAEYDALDAARERTRPTAPHERPRRPGAAVAQRHHPARGPAGRGRLRGALGLRLGCTRRRGRPDGQGLERLRAASQTHLDGVQRYFLGLVPDPDRDAIERGCNGILDELGREATADSSCAIGNG